MALEKNLIKSLSSDMCIDVDHLIRKISEPTISRHSKSLYKAIEEFHDALGSKDAENRIQMIFTNYEALFENEAVYGVLDSLRHAFDGFAYNGLHQLFTRQENEVWYPKIILTSELKPNDIATLDSVVEIYRGCGEKEYATSAYGQSWTTKKEIACLFAYKHYLGQPWFDLEERVILKSKIPRSAIYYSDQKGEFEVVVNTTKLNKPKLIKPDLCTC